MIIELFGPPGAGKTTLARVLADRLRERGHTVDLILSQRPAERSQRGVRPASHIQQFSPMIRRLSRPFVEMLTMARHPFALSHDVGTALNLIRILPPSNTLWSLRLAQYLSRLSRAWFQASNTGHIVLFDQAFVQAVCSLTLLCEATDEQLISHALDTIPKSDLLVRLNAPSDVLESRLRDRQGRESRIERLLELDLATSLRSLAIVDGLHELLRKADRRIMNAASLDQHTLDAAVDRIERDITAQFGVEHRETSQRDQAPSIRIDQPLERRTAS